MTVTSILVSVLAALEAGERQLDQQLAALEADAYILPEERAGPAAAYTFRHILIQESAYGMLLYERRRAYRRASRFGRPTLSITAPWRGTVAVNPSANVPRSRRRQRSRTGWRPRTPTSAHRAVTG